MCQGCLIMVRVASYLYSDSLLTLNLTTHLWPYCAHERIRNAQILSGYNQVLQSLRVSDIVTHHPTQLDSIQQDTMFK